MPLSLEPPPEGLYGSKEDLLMHCKEHAKQAGYALSILKSNAYSKSIIIACVCYGQLANKWKLTEENRKRPNHSSKKTGCRVSCIGKEQSDGRWRLTIREGEYNHRPAPVGTYAAHRKRETPVKVRIMQDLWAGCAVRQTHAQLQQQFPNILITKQDIFNKRVQAKARALQGRSVVEALFSELEDSGYYYPHQTFPENHEKAGTLSHLLVIHPRSLAIYKENFDVLILNCTYKTNRYNYPLLDLVSYTRMNTTFNLGLCFQHNKTQDDYEWTLEQLKTIFHANHIKALNVFVTDRDLALLRALASTFPSVPTLLCYWHVNKNVLTRAQVHMLKVVDMEKSTESCVVTKDCEACSIFMAA
ncbi:uncharacterized protein PV09_09719 [Verruconis gallopava]|uniref:MULE transposase domain-containing protein n=1 Tax=Verruconis gallopava TaxID=253628 RepID=A0A0D1ZWU0_9PEZI|nr:uncharacterized protein PV09_09719 [Verruconis gallopava]KIV98474.1 hypothetical protein PV09_09719 [Verruconis gallopava]